MRQTLKHFVPDGNGYRENSAMTKRKMTCMMLLLIMMVLMIKGAMQNLTAKFQMIYIIIFFDSIVYCVWKKAFKLFVYAGTHVAVDNMINLDLSWCHFINVILTKIYYKYSVWVDIFHFTEWDTMLYFKIIHANGSPILIHSIW